MSLSATSNLTLDKAAVISTSLEGILYGLSVFMFGVTFRELLRKHRDGQSSFPMMAVACLLLTLSTIHIIVDVVRLYAGFITLKDTFPGGPPAYFGSVSEWSFVFKQAVYIIHTVLGDGVVIYRCYVVWQSLYVVIVPIISLSGFIACGIGELYFASQAKAQVSETFFHVTGRWITAFYSTTLTTNILATGLLAFRIWKVQRAVAAYAQNRPLLAALRIVVESGVLYSATLFAALICFVKKSNGQYVVLDMIDPIISITFYMVIARAAAVGRGSTSSGGSNSFHAPQPMNRVVGSKFEMKPMEVHITRMTGQGDDYDPESGSSLKKLQASRVSDL